MFLLVANTPDILAVTTQQVLIRLLASSSIVKTSLDTITKNWKFVNFDLFSTHISHQYFTGVG
jgi:hypothetical protein